MKFLKKVSFFKIFLIDFKAKNDDSNNFRDEDDTWRLSSSEKDTQNAPLTGNLSSDDVQNNDNNDVESKSPDLLVCYFHSFYFLL